MDAFGRNAIMAAGSVVSRDVPEGMVVGGVTAGIKAEMNAPMGECEAYIV